MDQGMLRRSKGKKKKEARLCLMQDKIAYKALPATANK